MNNWNPLENQLRSWTPREPSPKLKQRLFAQATELPASSDAVVAFGGRWQWLAPGMGCFLLLLVLANPRNDRLSDWPAGSNQMWATIASNQNVSAYIMAESHSKQNGVIRETLEWTHGPRPLSGMNVPPTAATNFSSPSQ